MRLIQTSHLKAWAGSKLAEQDFPHVVKSLISAVVTPTKLRMPSGDAVWIPGHDGVIVNEEKNRFVPTGLSVWELGTNADFRGKAKSDYEKRSAVSLQLDDEVKAAKLDRSQTTFLFVTPFVWVDKDDWAAQRTLEGIWKEVKVIDGADLQDWLEAAPAVSLGFAADIGLTPETGLQTADQAWADWSHMTDPPVSPELVTVGRDDQENELIGRLVADPSTFAVRGDSQREVWGFVLAALRRVNTADERASFKARTVVAENEAVAGGLRNLANLVLVLKQTTGQVSGALSSRGSHVVVPEGNDSYSDRNPILLPRPTHRAFSEVLESMGMPPDDSERTARACGRSVTIYQRQRAHANVVVPGWVEKPTTVHLLPALLAGRWSADNQQDRAALCLLAGVPDYEGWEGQLQEFLLVDQPPLQRIGELWTMTAPVDAFQLIARRLTAQQLQRYMNAFQLVFGRLDPKVELPPEEWMYHSLKGEPSHSAWLRSGMAETLLLIADRGADAKLVCVQSPRGFAEQIMKAVPGLNDDWRVLASLRDQYPRLMEAAPRPLLDSLEYLLEAKPEDVRRLSIEGEGIFGGGPMHTGLLWGLETLAWSPDHFQRVVLLLARLARLDPGGRWINRPINSLREILLWWHPGTNATMNQRLTAIDSILDHEPAVGWTLITSLLPNTSSSISHPTARPRWRDFGDLPADVTPQGQLVYLSSVIDRVLDHVGSEPKRWSAVLESLGVLSAPQRDRALELLDVLSRGTLPQATRAELWELLREYIHKNRTFESADWALTGKPIDRLADSLARLAPNDSIERNRWLFDEWVPDLPSGPKDWREREQDANRLRREAVADVVQAQGTAGLISLATTCKYPGLVASAAMPVLGDPIAVLSTITQTLHTKAESGLAFASQMSGQARLEHGDAWRSLFLTEAGKGTWAPGVVGSLLVWWPDERTTWNDVASLGDAVSTEYWRGKPVLNISGQVEDTTFHIDQLIKVGRAGQAFHRIATNAREVPTESLVRVFDATLRELAEATGPDEVRHLGLRSYEFREFLDELRKRDDMSREDLARREYQALPLLGSMYSRGLTLHEFMGEDPTFFIDVICDCFLPAHRDKSQAVGPTADQQARARVAYTLLKGMDRIPGQSAENGIDDETLLQWVVAVRQKGAEKDRAVITDLEIGAVLAHSPEDPEDAAWPHRAVRSVIDKVASEDIARGLVTERFNMRGVYTKSIGEGGVQERGLASQYRTWADVSRRQWPRMARILETVAEGWENDARREDTRAEQEKLE